MAHLRVMFGCVVGNGTVCWMAFLYHIQTALLGGRSAHAQGYPVFGAKQTFIYIFRMI